MRCFTKLEIKVYKYWYNSNIYTMLLQKACCIIYNNTMNFIVAIDGTVASGKGTVARMLARRFGVICLDTGALYRGITIHFMDNEVDITDTVSFNRALGEIDLTVKCVEGVTYVYLAGEDISTRIRENDVSVMVPQVAKIPEVRTKVREIQQRISSESSLICEGRDITSVVFPDARFKFYLTASVRQRALRRLKDLRENGDNTPLEDLEKQISDRDYADMTRETSPLVCVKDAVKIDASKITAFEVVRRMENIITKAIDKDYKKFLSKGHPNRNDKNLSGERGDDENFKSKIKCIAETE